MVITVESLGADLFSCLSPTAFKDLSLVHLVKKFHQQKKRYFHKKRKYKSEFKCECFSNMVKPPGFELLTLTFPVVLWETFQLCWVLKLGGRRV